ncbi:endonuclease V, partial [Erwinia persicina]|nr:endonuclease V [Erwinia persicina]
MDIAALRNEQRQRAAEILCQDDFDVMPPRFIGGADVG